jgi:A/G-specific adenine glycosylase
MLQQTRVDQMSAYYERFLQSFPTVADLAQASEARVLKAWEGLGYYGRARRLRRAARHLVDHHGGRVPSEYETLLALPGVGPYTAAAVSSIAFDRPHPVLDGNVRRVLCRLLRVEGDPRTAAVGARLIAAGQRLLAPGQPGEFNQAMMELGARVCVPGRPQCPRCPVRAACRACRELADPGLLPRRPPRRPRPHYQVAAGIIWRGTRLLIAQRRDDSMLGGLWEFPGGKQEEGESLPECLAREIREELDIEIEGAGPLVSLDHAYTHFSITLHVLEARYRRGRTRALGCADWRWVRPHELGGYPFSRADGRVIEQLFPPAGAPVAAGRKGAA